MEKLTVLERMEQLLLKWENPEKATNPKAKKSKSSEPMNPNFHQVATSQEESLMGEKPLQLKGTDVEPTSEEMPHPSQSTKMELGCKIEALQGRLRCQPSRTRIQKAGFSTWSNFLRRIECQRRRRSLQLSV